MFIFGEKQKQDMKKAIEEVEKFNKLMKDTLDHNLEPSDLILVSSISIPESFAQSCDDCRSVFNSRYSRSCPSCGSSHFSPLHLAYHKQVTPVKPV